MTEKTMPAVLSEFDAALQQLSNLQREYEWQAERVPHSEETELAAAQLSNAVGRFLAENGYEATL